jgi:carboxynorspermidine decarboxylase
MNINELQTPYYVVDKDLLEKNLQILKGVSDRTGCKILLAQKAFSMFEVYPLIAEYLAGATASGLYEAMLGYEEFKKENHIYAPAYLHTDFPKITEICDHIVFNSLSQLNEFKSELKENIAVGIRINPEYSEIETDIYNPCFQNSRMGTTLDNFERELAENEDLLDLVSGLHFHTMCEQNSDVLARTIRVVDEKFGKYISKMKWINFGGGHHITRNDYDITTLEKCIMFFKDKYGVEVYLEPGEAVALNSGFLVSTVLDTMQNNMNIAILDTSAACHMPDVLEMPYRPNIIGSGESGKKAYTYRLGGPTCLAGDIIGDYSFDKPLQKGDRLVFCDMAIYSMVKNNTFNGMKLPSIATYSKTEGMRLVKRFEYEDFKQRLS